MHFCFFMYPPGQPWGCPGGIFREFSVVFQTHTNLNTFNKPCLFVIPTEGTDSVDDLIDLLQRLSVHEPVEFFEVGLDGCVIEAAGFVIGIEQHLQGGSRHCRDGLAAGLPDGFGGQS